MKEAGFADSLASNLKNNRIKRLNLPTIERLCILLQCTPNDFMEWIPDKDTAGVSPDHPINRIKKTDKVVDIAKALSSVPLEKLGEIEALIKNEIKSY